MSSADAFSLTGFLNPGVEPDDVPTLWALVRARPMVDTFIALFRGGEEEVFIRLHVLREIGARADLPRWLPEELRRHFAYIDPVKLETVLARLRSNGLMVFGDSVSSQGTYQLSDSGRNAVAAVSALLRFGENEDSELGFLTTQLAGMQATGTITPEMLQHLLAKLNALTASFEDAIASGSEFRILDARSRLSGNLRWLEKGTQILRSLLAGEDSDHEITPEVARIAHSIGLAQSRLARVDAAFQRALNKIESQRVTLGASGVSSSDAAAWLRSLDIRRIAALADGALGAGPQAQFLAGGHELLDRAESVLSEEVRKMESETALPPAEIAPVSQAAESEDLGLLVRLSEKLAAIPTAAPAHKLVLGGGFGPASYRLSLLSLLGNEEAQAEGPVADLTQMPYDLMLEAHLAEVMEDEVSHISAGNVVRRGT